MKLRQPDSISELFFRLTLLVGIIWGIFVVTAGSKIVPAMAMEIVFLIEAIKSGSGVEKIIMATQFWIDSGSFGLWIGMLWLLIDSTTVMIKKMMTTKHFLDHLWITKTSGKIMTVASNQSLLFTAGLIKPRIYLADSLLTTHTAMEIKAMLAHEENHVAKRHPLKLLLAKWAINFLPIFGIKKWLYESYLTSTEVAADSWAEVKIKTKLPIVSALYKLEQMTLPSTEGLVMSGFDSQSRRIEILVGQKKLEIKKPLLAYLSIVAIVAVLTITLNHSSIYFSCQHVVHCFQNLLTDHCQQVPS